MWTIQSYTISSQIWAYPQKASTFQCRPLLTLLRIRLKINIMGNFSPIQEGKSAIKLHETNDTI